LEHLAIAVTRFELDAQHTPTMMQFAASGLENEELAAAVARLLAQHAIEENRSAAKNTARLAAQLLECPSGSAFHHGLLTALIQYFECRDQLRVEHFSVWLAFLAFISDLFASFGFIYEGELVDIIFRVFNYMLRAPVLETLKIQELEAVIASMLSIGYDLERQCPDQLGLLRDSIRDAVIEVHEPWARKMILLLTELAASGWRLPIDANEYYFQHRSV